MRRLVFSITMAFVLMLPALAQAQQARRGEYFHMPLNVSLYQNEYRDYSLGRMLGGGRPVINYIGLNIFSGRTAQLRGIEIGGFGNIQEERMTGIQLAGAANVVGGPGTGIQLAGIANIADGSFSFLQGSMVANVVDGNFLGVQGTGIANVVDGSAAGVQVGGIANVVDGNGYMIQAGGIANVIGGGGGGAQGAFIANVADGPFTGIQITGLANVVGDDSRSIQAAGLANVANGNAAGVQFAGLANVMNGNARSIQAAGLANVANANATGMQIAGLANVFNADSRGIQAATLANVANGNAGGVQLTGLANVVNGDLVGLQAAGMVNVVNGATRGVQLAGMVNVANNSGLLVQAGPINVATGNRVLPIGAYSVVGNNPTYTEYWVTESGFVKTGIRSGSDWFHNVVFTGIRIGDPLRWSLGWGLGIHRPVSERFAFDLDGSIEHINEDEFWTSDRNVLGILRFMGNWRISDRIAIVAGPTFNYLVSEVNDGDDIAPWTMSDDFSGGEWKRSWIGIEAGLRYTRMKNDFRFDFFDGIFSGFSL